MSEKKQNWKELPKGDVLEAGTSLNFKTGDWRSKYPVHDKKRCINCMLCWAHCPDGAVKIKDGKVVGFNLEYCKGCGICAEVCPTNPKSISMKDEKKS